MKIDLKFNEETFHATAFIDVTEPKTESVTFMLNASLNIEGITCIVDKTEKETNWAVKGNAKLEFRSLASEIAVSCVENADKIVVRYGGSVDIWYNVITDEIKAINWYSVWFPQEISVPQEHDETEIMDASDYFIVKGIYNENTGTWTYGGRGYDIYNIIAYKKDVLKVASNEYLNIYYVDDNISKAVEKTKAAYRTVLDYYNGTLFEHRQIDQLDIACLSPAIQEGGAYKRKSLIFTDVLDSSIDTERLIAHELAHEWCTGAGPGWEDWLNETTAEWSALLYALRTDNQELFDTAINYHLNLYEGLPPIKTADGSRPNGVHDKGTILFYRIYQKYGVDVIRKLVQIFVALDDKYTDKFISTVEKEISTEVADCIRVGILI